MRVLLDGSSWQVHVHRAGGGIRLRDLIGLLESRLDATVAVGKDAPLAEQDLRNADVLIIPTRHRPYPEDDLEVAEDFVRRGGGLLLLANHADLPGKNPNNHAEHDAILASRLGLQIEETWFQASDRSVLTLLPVDDHRHPVLAGPAGLVNLVVVGNCTSLTDNAATGLVPLHAGVTDYRSGESPEGRFAFVAADVGDGRVVAGGDSGLTGSWETVRPGPGLLDRADNSTLLLNAVAWLGRDG